MTIRDNLVLLQKTYLESSPVKQVFTDGLETDPGLQEAVNEALEKVHSECESGCIVSRVENPFGQDIDRLTMFVMGDTHIPSDDPRREALNRSPLYKTMQDIGVQSLKQRGRNRSYTADNKDQSNDSWALQEKPRYLVDGFNVLKEHLKAEVKRVVQGQSSDNDQPKSALAIIDLGDRTGTDALMGDVAFTALEFMQLRQEAENQARYFGGNKDIHVPIALLQGNHDDDPNNHPLKGVFERQLYGSQIFAQEVGEDTILLSINAEPFDPLYQQEISKLKDNPDFEEYFRLVETEMRQQQELISWALEQNKDIVLLTHDENLAKKLIDFSNSRITHIVCGHTHKATEQTLSEKNVAGNSIRLIRVGSSLGGIPGFETMPGPIGFTIEIDPKADEKIKVKKFDQLYSMNDFRSLT